jgi:tRNA/rRNA methyltransferase
MALDLCRVVLIETHYPGNLGATARVMRNMGLRDLVLVNSIADPRDAQALQMSTHGEAILRSARRVASLDAAVGDCAVVVGTSARTGGLFRRQSVDVPRAIMPAVAQTLRQGQTTAFVFGPEPSGLDNDTVTRCHQLVRIPTADDYAALNLAQAVAICLYELRLAWDAAEPAQETDTLATFAEQEQLFRQLQTALEEIHFVYGEKGEPLMHAVRHLLGRARLGVMEVKVLLGLARQIRWYVANHRQTIADEPQAGPQEPQS